MTERLIDLPTSTLLDKFGKGNHKPGSGSAAALQGLLSAQLLQTVISLTIEPARGLRYAEHLPRLREIKVAIENRIVPSLERLFQEDSNQFDKVIQLRRDRNNATDPVMRRNLAQQATLALVPATEIPIQIAKDCMELASFALDVFDKGFQSALGDSGVAISAALSAVFGCLSIVELNLQHLETDSWTENIAASREMLTMNYGLLTEQARRRLDSQVERTARKTEFSREIQSIAVAAKGKKSLLEAEIEAIAVRMQLALRMNRESRWKHEGAEDIFEDLDPDKALSCFGFIIERPQTLGQHSNQATTFEVAGEIDQPSRTVSISMRFPKETQRFTAAHELGHYLLHTQSHLHRDRPLDGTRFHEPRDSEEWQADKFAAYFLMPSKLVREAFQERFLTERFDITELTAFALNENSSSALRDRCTDLRGLSRLLASTISYNGVQFYSLRERFNVSVEAIAIRLEELELVDFSA